MAAAPKVGFVSLGCPKLWSILKASSRACARKATQSRLRTTARISCRQHLRVHRVGDSGIAGCDRRGLEANGRVIVTGCLGAKAPTSRAADHPKVLAVTGPHALEES